MTTPRMLQRFRPLMCAVMTLAVAVSILPANSQEQKSTKRRPVEIINQQPSEPQKPEIALPEATRLGGKADIEARPSSKGGQMERLNGNLWIEGPGFEVTYGLTYERCATKCIDNQKCVMIEFYRPEKKCNLYSQKRPTKKGGSSDVAIRG